MIDALMFWMMKPLAELGLGLAVLAVLALVWLVAILPSAVRQARCQHLRVGENRVLDCICRDCGKNLGFDWKRP